MIPTLILFGLIFGRWWWQTLAVSAIGWPIVLIADGGMGFGQALAGGAIIAVLNTGAGVLVHQGLLWSYRWLRPDRP